MFKPDHSNYFKLFILSFLSFSSVDKMVGKDLLSAERMIEFNSIPSKDDRCLHLSKFTGRLPILPILPIPVSIFMNCIKEP